MRLAEPTPWSADRLELGEGARWVDGRLILVVLLAGRLLETGGDEPGPLRELRRLDAPLGAVAPVAGAAGNWLAAVGTGREDTKTGQTEHDLAGIGDAGTVNFHWGLLNLRCLVATDLEAPVPIQPTSPINGVSSLT